MVKRAGVRGVRQTSASALSVLNIVVARPVFMQHNASLALARWARSVADSVDRTGSVLDESRPVSYAAQR